MQAHIREHLFSWYTMINKIFGNYMLNIGNKRPWMDSNDQPFG